METKILLRNESLWEGIQGFSLDNPDATFPFSKKLAKEENWTLDFTQKAIEEYKKFVYLCCISPNGASPSEVVDKVWHLHLIYTQNYWEEFCPKILKQNLHHHPSNGGFEEKNKHENWFAETLKNYREIFSQEPSEDIWDNNVKKLEPKKSWRKSKLFYFTLLLLLVYSCSGFGSSGIFTLFITVIIGSFLSIMIFASSFGESGSRGKNNSNSNSDGGSGGGSSCGGGGSSCGGGGCGGGCGGCGGG